MRKPYNLLVTGVGGQGTVVASDILAAVGLEGGYEVKKSDVLGLAVPGGSVVSHIRWGEHVHSPVVPEGQVDLLLAFELLEGLRWLDQLRPAGAVLVNQQRIFPVVVSAGLAAYPGETETTASFRRAARHVYALPGLAIAQELGNTRTLNVVLLGALSRLTEVDPEIWTRVIARRVPARLADLNIEAFRRGRAAMSTLSRRASGRSGGSGMRILVINPNTSAGMTDHIRRALEDVKGETTQLTVLNPVHGPVSIESAYDEAFAIPATLELVKTAERDGYHAVLLACFSDPGLDAARELVSIPVVGIEESALHVAAMLGHRFTVLTSRRERVPSKMEHVARLGLERHLASVRPLELSVLEMDADPVRAQGRIMEVAAQAVQEDGAEVIVLGCAGLAGYAARIQVSLGVVVIDPTPVALKMAELLVRLRLNHSKRGLYAPPPPKEFR